MDPGEIQLCQMGRLRVGLQYAQQLGATHAIMTGKDDPLQRKPEYLLELIRQSRHFLPFVDVHTNGLELQPGGAYHGRLEELARGGGEIGDGLTMITFSIASFDRLTNQRLMGKGQDPDFLIKEALRHQLMVRASLVVNQQGATNNNDILDYVMEVGSRGAHSVVVREVWAPETYSLIDQHVFDWNHENLVHLNPLENSFEQAAEQRGIAVARLPDLPWGTKVFEIGGGMFTHDPSHAVQVTFAICDQEMVGGALKSIVHLPNGHGYPSWDRRGGILY
jgi:hypothetical protein